MSALVKSFDSEENLETFSLLWLDASVNNCQENIDAQHQLRTSINFLRTFEDIDPCETYIRSKSKDDRIILITSGRLGQIIVPRIHSLRPISAIYVYCKDKKLNEPWANQYKKVRGVIVLLDELISQIRSDQAVRTRKKIDEPFPMNFNEFEQSTSDLGGQFIHSELLLDCLLRMQSNPTDKSELISLCRKYYQGNDVELSVIKEFENSYCSDRALWWYTRETFLFRLMNRAFRVMDFDLLYLMRFFIRDLEQELQKRQYKKPAHLYRGQSMSRDEVELLRKSIGKYIAMNSYFSTSVSRHQALLFLHYCADLEQVLFEIDANPQLKGIKPFADVTALSYYSDEEEVLFMSGSIFRILNVDCDDDGVWLIRLELANDENHDGISTLNQMKTEYNEQEANILTYGDILHRMGKFDQAEKYHRYFLAHSSKNPKDIAHCYHSLGTVATAKGKYNESLQWHLDSLEMKVDLFPPDDPKIAASHNSIAIVHRKKGDYEQALSSYKKALIIWRKTFGDYHPKIAMGLNNIGAVFEDRKEYPDALGCYEEALKIGKKLSPIDHRTLSATHNNLGNIYYQLKQYDQALENYKESYRIKSQYLPKRHPKIAEALETIGMVYEKEGEMSKAQEYYQLASQIKH